AALHATIGMATSVGCTGWPSHVPVTEFLTGSAAVAAFTAPARGSATESRTFAPSMRFTTFSTFDCHPTADSFRRIGCYPAAVVASRYPPAEVSAAPMTARFRAPKWLRPD